MIVIHAQVLLRAGESSAVSMPLRQLPDLAIWSSDVRFAVYASVLVFDSLFCLAQVHMFVSVQGTFILEACSSSSECHQTMPFAPSIAA